MAAGTLRGSTEPYRTWPIQPPVDQVDRQKPLPWVGFAGEGRVVAVELTAAQRQALEPAAAVLRPLGALSRGLGPAAAEDLLRQLVRLGAAPGPSPAAGGGGGAP